MKKTFKKVCPACGKEYVTDKKEQVCCCRKCANSKGKRKKVENYDASLVWERLPSDPNRWQCPYHNWISCRTRNCEKCGWYPPVTKARLEALQEKGK